MKEILIAGGGIGGLAAALALARKGRKVRVLEKAAEFGEIGYGIQMGPNVSRMLQRFGVRYFVIHRRDLHGGLLEACKRQEGIVLESSRGVLGFSEEKNLVKVKCENSADYEGAALIGADGLWSPTRQAVIGDGAPRPAGHFVYRGVVPDAEITDRSRSDSMTIWGGPNLHLVQYRLRGGTVMNNVATIASRRFRRGEGNAGAPDELEATFARCH